MKQDYTVGDLIYDASIYDGMNTQMDDLPFYRKWLSQKPNARVLELCCGTGRLTIPLAKEGFDITGVDLTPSMLEQAKRKAAEEGLDIPLIEGDMRTLNLGASFNIVFIPFNSIHHLYRNEDLFEALKTVKHHLKSDGLFLLDCFSPNIRYITAAEKEQQVIAEYATEDGRNVRIVQEMRYESATQINRISWHYHIDDAFHSVQDLDMRMYYPQELDAYLQSAGFKILHKFGGFQEEAFGGDSDKQIFVLEH